MAETVMSETALPGNEICLSFIIMLSFFRTLLIARFAPNKSKGLASRILRLREEIHPR